MDEYLRTNQSLWNGWTDLHERSPWYDIKGFKAGKSSLKQVELDEVGEVAGRSFLHLQCHFGKDTLSWARLGARVTGVDFSDRAIALADSLATELDIDARFICSNIFDLPDVLDEQMDIVFTSYGTIGWLPDISRWGRLAASYVKPGGTFYMVEFHPFVHMLGDDGRNLEHPYFHSDEPNRAEEKGSYAEPDADFSHTSYWWAHTIGDVVSSLIAAGLRIEFLHEFPYSSYGCFPFTQAVGPDRHVLNSCPGGAPLMFSVRATKPLT